MSTRNYLTPTRRYKRLISAIHSVYRLVNSTFELKDLVIRLARLVCQILDARYCVILILDPTKKFSSFRCIVSGRTKKVIDNKQKITNGLEKKIIDRLVTVRNHHLLGLPLISEDVMGLIIVKRGTHQAAFDNYDQDTLTAMLEQVMIGIKNMQLYVEQQKIVLGSLKSLVSLLDKRVPQEYTHSSYFSKLVTMISHQMNIDQKQAESIEYASLLHDAGKVDIPLEILTKTSKLTPQEFRIIKTHPIKGVQILRPLQVLKPAIPIIMHHHEKFDGTGYPSKLKKGQIPLGARIMAVADAFEAMVYGRPYRERMNIDKAINEIRKKSGTQFDPRVVEAFMKISKKVAKKYLQLRK
ncbi:MAG: HD domain-containing phosphohydrolase [Candidatus Omnitrophota bacterium]